MISPAEVKMIANEHRFDIANIEKVLRLIDLLSEIYAHPYLKERFVLKGGTAINVFIFDMPRLSVDIDLNYVGSPQKEVMFQERVIIGGHLDRILRLQHYEKEFAENYGSDRYELWYRNISGIRDRIKLEINYLLRVPLLKPIIPRKRKLFSQISLPRVLIVAPEELFASKIIALLSRHAARDLYDVDRLSTQNTFEIKKSLLKTCMIFYGIIAREDFRTMSIDTIEKVTAMDIKRTLYPLLQRQHRFDLRRSLQNVRRFIEPLFRFTKKEKEFINAFFSGQYHADLLFKPRHFSHDLTNHPMVDWKVIHIQKHFSH